MKRLIFAFIFLLPLSVRAEYRAFELVITDSTSGQERVVISSLDPLQYRHYQPVRAFEKIVYRDTWMCRGNTSNFKPVCAKPEPRVQRPAPPAVAKPATVSKPS
jgi:hypothetical protein